MPKNIEKVVPGDENSSKSSKPISNILSSTRDNIHQDIIARLKIMEFPQDFLSKDGKYSVYKLKGESEVNKLYDFTITFVSESAIDISEIADKNVELKLSDQNSVQEKTFCGQVYNVSEKSVVSNKHMYEIKISSPLRYLSLNKRYEIYHTKKASEIIKELFSRYSALLNIKLDLKVDASISPIREYTTQYGQSDLSFIFACEDEKLTVNTIFCPNSSLPHKNTFTLTTVSLKNILTRSLDFEQNLAFTDSFYNRKVS